MKKLYRNKILRRNDVKEEKDVYYWKKIFQLLKPYKLQVILVMLCLLMSAVVTFLQPLLISKLTDLGLLKVDIAVITYLTLSILFLVVIGELITIFQSYVFISVHNSFYLALSSRCFEKIMKLKVTYFTNRNSAEIIENVRNDISNVSLVTDEIFGITIGYFFTVISGLIGLLIISWKLTVIVILIVPLKYIIVNWFSKITRKLTEERLEKLGFFTKWYSDNINGIKEIKLWELYGKKKKIFEKKQKELLNIYKKETILRSWNSGIEGILGWIITGLLYILGGIQMAKGELSLGGVIAFVTYSSYVTSPIMVLLNLRLLASTIIPSARRLFQMLELEEEADCGKIKFHGDIDIEYKHVFYAYEEGKDILKDINIKIAPGEKIAIIGKNGSGKTTFLNLLLRFLEPQSGEIVLGGGRISDISMKEYRNLFAVVDQAPYLFSGSIKENIDLDRKSDQDIFEEICEKSGVGKFVSKMPEKEESLIGENGAKLSGGEKKKIAVARALLKKAPIVILDEATAGYDNESDEDLIDFLIHHMQGKTLIVITHTYRQLKSMDRVYQIENGKLFEINKNLL